MRTNGYFAEFLARIGVERVYLLSGGMIAPLIDAVGEHPALSIVNTAHEQAGGFSADAEARLTRKPGVALGTSGPGALNLVTSLASSFYDSVPAIFVSGQVQSYLQKEERAIRQFALQECEFSSVARSISKAVFPVRTAEKFPETLAEAYVTSMSGRPGPTVLEVPFDVQISETGAADVRVPTLPQRRPPSAEALSKAAESLIRAKRPLVLAGGGVRCASARAACLGLAERFRLPLATTIAALDVVPQHHPLRVGMPGMYGVRKANLALNACDLLLVLGSRLDHGVLGADPEAFARRREIVRVDIDPGELTARSRKQIAVEADVGLAIATLGDVLARHGYLAPAAWACILEEMARAHPDTAERPPGEGVDPNLFFARLGESSREAGAFCVDAGQHTWFCAQSLTLHPGQRFVSSTGLWSMGAALPAAIGAALALGRPAVAIAGDASIQLNIQELAVADREKVAIKVVVLDNGAHGMVRQFQTEFIEGRHHGTVWGYRPPDLCAIFAAYGFEAQSVERRDEIDDALAWLWADPLKRQLLRVRTDVSIDVSPSVPFGLQLRDMRPATPAPGQR